MRWVQHCGSAASRIAIAVSLSLALSGSVSAQEAPPENTKPADEPTTTVPDVAGPQPQTAPSPDNAPADKPVEMTTAAEPLKPWTVSCTEATNANPARCQMSQTLANQQTGRRIISVSIRSQPEGISMVMALPHGLHLPGGVTYQIDSGPQQKASITLSDEKGVYALLPMNDTLFNSMKRGSVFKVNLVAPNQRQMQIPMTLSGFTAAANEMTASN